MRQPGEQSPPNPEMHENLNSLVRELHFSMFGTLIEYADPVVRWPAADGSAEYIAVNVPILGDYDSNTSATDTYKAIGQYWEIIRTRDNPATGKRDVTSYDISPAEQGFRLDVLKSVGMPRSSANTELISLWSLYEHNNRERQKRLGIMEPTTQDYETLESALTDLKAFNEVYFSDYQVAFAIAERNARQGN
ncbi:MAG: hypothetical protein ABIR37_03310 [Candidatus Saccharimonadales bacterium]